MAQVVEVASGLQFPEGPTILPDGSIAVVEIAAGTVTRVYPDGRKVEIAQTGAGPNGLALGPDGNLYVCNNGGGFNWSRDSHGHLTVAMAPEKYTGGGIQKVDPGTGHVTQLYSGCGDVGLRGPNDIVFDRQGGFYFSDLGKLVGRQHDLGTVYYALPDGSSIRQVVFPMQMPNGVGLSPDEKVLYVSETATARLWAFDITSPGSVAKKGRMIYAAPVFKRYDSLAVEACGNICVASLEIGGIDVISPAGKLVEFMPMPDAHCTNICFAGPDLRTAYVTLSGMGQLVKQAWPRPGLRLNFYPAHVAA